MKIIEDYNMENNLVVTNVVMVAMLVPLRCRFVQLNVTEKNNITNSYLSKAEIRTIPKVLKTRIYDGYVTLLCALQLVLIKMNISPKKMEKFLFVNVHPFVLSVYCS